MNLSLGIELLIALLNNAGAVSALIQKAQAAGTDISVQDLQALLDADTLARARLVVAIAAARAAGK